MASLATAMLGMPAPAAAQQAIPGSDLDCPIVNGAATCSGDFSRGINADLAPPLVNPLALPAISPTAGGQDGTWLQSPPATTTGIAGTFGTYNAAENWDSGTVPMGTAFFGPSDITNIAFNPSIGTETTVGG
ncbi:MAG: hypothetical protein COA41_10290 [Sphingopyxis sp.]|nr:MAG: hypothetical protein COA41_10290 [Sphingopyxis sp.]